MKERNEKRDANRDPITGEPGSHPVGVGAGTTAGAIAGAAAGAVAGPAGAVAGAVLGGVAGGFGGKAAAEWVNPSVEEKYWRENYRSRPYVDEDDSFDSYAPAYETGYLGFAKYGPEGKSYDEVESELREDYENQGDDLDLTWEDARGATRDAWSRAEMNAPKPQPTVDRASRQRS